VLLNNLISEEYQVDNLPKKLDITGITADSRKVKPGFLFAALPGVNVNGSKFIAQAIENGASLIIAQDDGQVVKVDGATIEVKYKNGQQGVYRLNKFLRSNASTCIKRPKRCIG